jgi:Flp pilus assembly pilin Flp
MLKAQAMRFFSFCRGERGAITTEYAIVAATCAIVISGALAALGPPLLASYQSSRHTLIAPVP